MRGALCSNAKKLKIDISLRPGFVEKSCSCEFGKAEKSGHHYSVQKITRNHNYFNIHVFSLFSARYVSTRCDICLRSISIF